MGEVTEGIRHRRHGGRRLLRCYRGLDLLRLFTLLLAAAAAATFLLPLDHRHCLSPDPSAGNHAAWAARRQRRHERTAAAFAECRVQPLRCAAAVAAAAARGGLLLLLET